MTDPAPVTWPPAPIRTERLVLREPAPRDRPAFVDLFSSPEVGTYVGGASDRDELERSMPEVPGRRPGVFVADLDDTMVGVVLLERRPPAQVRPEAGRFELGYLFLPRAWGRGYALEACAAVLEWFAAEAPGEPVVLCTQSANAASMRLAARLGFTELERFEQFGAEQWLGVRVG